MDTYVEKTEALDAVQRLVICLVRGKIAQPKEAYHVVVALYRRYQRLHGPNSRKTTYPLSPPLSFPLLWLPHCMANSELLIPHRHIIYNVRSRCGTTCSCCWSSTTTTRWDGGELGSARADQFVDVFAFELRHKLAKALFVGVDTA